VPNFGHSEVLIKMTDEIPLLLAPRHKIVTLNIFGTKFSISISLQQRVAPDGFVFYTDELLLAYF
jgi:hypothetical protein